MIAPDEEEFIAWRANPVTQYVMAGVLRYAEMQRQAWVDASWKHRVADHSLLLELHTRADAYEGLASLTYENAIGLHEDEPA